MFIVPTFNLNATRLDCTEVLLETIHEFSVVYFNNHTTPLSYRLGPVNSNTVNSKFHLIQIFAEIVATFLSFHC